MSISPPARPRNCVVERRERKEKRIKNKKESL
jgi:hypothetical protein